MSLKAPLVFILFIMLCMPLNVRCERLYDTAGYFKEIDPERSTVIIEEATYEYGNPVTGEILELKVDYLTRSGDITGGGEETGSDDEGGRSGVLQSVMSSDGDAIIIYTEGKQEVKYKEELISENIDEITKIFSEGDKVKVTYDENFVLSSITKYPQNCTIYEDGFSLSEEQNFTGISIAESSEKGCGYIREIDGDKIIVEEASFAGIFSRNNPKTGKILEFFGGNALINDVSDGELLQLEDLKQGDKIGYYYTGNTIIGILRVPRDWKIMESPEIEEEDGPTTLITVGTPICGKKSVSI